MLLFSLPLRDIDRVIFTLGIFHFNKNDEMVSLADSSRLKSILAARSWCQECERALHPEVRADSHALTYAHLAQPAFSSLR